MELLDRTEIERRLASQKPERISIDPLLDNAQIGEVTIDLRLGYDFLVSILTRRPFIGLTPSDGAYRGIETYFQSTRREIGDKFVLYPNQVVLTTTLEYVGLPSDVYADIFPRSSYSRLGVHFATMMQPGYRGCFPVELANLGNNPIELVVGSRVLQARLFSLQNPRDYSAQAEPRKYFGATRPVVSRAASDSDLQRLTKIAGRRIHAERTLPTIG